MNELLAASLRFPTVIFTIALGVALVYWLFVVIGALDIDLFHSDAATGGAKGGVEALKGLGGDGQDGHDADGGVLDWLGLGSVPITISFTVIMLLCWVTSLLGMHYAAETVGDLRGWLPALMVIVVLVVGVVIGGVLVRPLGPLFDVQEGKSNRDYVGHTCTITTGKVDDGFGQATVEDGGTVLVIPVRCDRTGALGRGQKALIIDFDRAREAYVVEPTTGFLAPTGEE